MSVSTSEAFAKTQFRLPGHLFFIVFGIMFIAIETLLGQLFYLTLERGILLILGLGVALTVISLAARRFVDEILGRCGMMMPTIVLWMYPLATFALTWLLSWVLLRVVPELAGRGFWTAFLRLNAKTVTGAFNGPFLSFFLVILIWTFIEAWRYLRWSIGWADFVTKLSAEGGLPPIEVMAERRERQRAIEVDRERARHWNRLGTLAVFAGLIGTFVWITYFRPELILYYRGMAQLRTFQKPEAALDAFEQLIRKYPDYRYADSVRYFIAWVEERRLGRFADAARSYEAYLREYGSDNVWADDVLANLVRLALDKLNDPAAALRWTAEYRRIFPEGIMAPHIALYEVRALMVLGRTDDARAALTAARSRFGNVDFIIYDSEDEYAGRIPFEAAAAALGL